MTPPHECPTTTQVAGHETSRSLDRRDPPDIVFCRRRRTSPGSRPSKAEAVDVTVRNRSSARSWYPASSLLRFPSMNSSSIGTAFAMNDNNSTLLEHKLDTHTRTSQGLPTDSGEGGDRHTGRFPRQSGSNAPPPRPAPMPPRCGGRRSRAVWYRLDAAGDLPARVESLGAQRLKNIPEPVVVSRLVDEAIDDDRTKPWRRRIPTSARPSLAASPFVNYGADEDSHLLMG